MGGAYDILRKIKFNKIINNQKPTNMIQWLNGKKTIIGSIFLVLAVFGTEVMQNIWNMKCLPDEINCAYGWLANTITTFNWIGMVMGGVGLTHKAVKASKQP